MTDDKRRQLFPKKHPEHGYYTTNPIHAPGVTRNGDTGMEWQGISPPPGRHWRYSRAVLDELNNQGLIEWSNTGNPRKIVLAKDHKGFKIQDVWEFKDKGLSYVDYPTQKNNKLLDRIIQNSSRNDSVVLDCFSGSGSTLLAANKHGRKWIGVDNSTKSLEVITRTFNNKNIDFNMYEYVPLN
jgi:adenine-specific DNA-methyltransferase